MSALGGGQDLGGDNENRETGDCLKSKQCNFFIQKAEVKIVLKQLTVRSRLRPTQIFFYCKEGLSFTVFVHCTAGVVKRRLCFCMEGLNFAVILPLLFLGLAVMARNIVCEVTLGSGGVKR